MKPNKTNRLRETNNPLAYEALLHGTKCEREGDLIRAECWYRKASREGSAQGHAALKRVQNQRIPNSITARDSIEYQRNLDRANAVEEKDKIAPSLSIPKENERILVKKLTPGQPSDTNPPHTPERPGTMADKQSTTPLGKTSIISFLEKQAENGDANAQFELGQYFEKKGKKQQAHRWYKKATEQGHVDAKFRLGLLYLQKAISYLQNAASQNHEQAVEELDRLTKSEETPIPEKALHHVWINDASGERGMDISRIERLGHKTGVSHPVNTTCHVHVFSAYEIPKEKDTASIEPNEHLETEADLLRVWMEKHSSVENCEGIAIANGATGNHGDEEDSGIWEMAVEECAETESSGHELVDGEQHNIDRKETPSVSGCICCRLIQWLKTIFSIK